MFQDEISSKKQRYRKRMSPHEAAKCHLGGDGQKADNVIQENPYGVQLMQNRSQLSSDPSVSNLLADYGTGKMSLNDALSKAQGVFDQKGSANSAARADVEKQRQAELAPLQNAMNNMDGHSKAAGLDKAYQKQIDAINSKYNDKLNQMPSSDQGGMMDQFMNLVTTNPLAAQRYGTDELATNQLTSGLFGENGMQHQAENDAQTQMGNMDNLIKDYQSGQWKQINTQDADVYGSMLGDLARNTAQNEQGLSQSLADRGLGAGPSGAALQGVSDIYGNKNEQLAQAQTNMVQNKMNQAMQQYSLANSMIGGQEAQDQSTATNLGALGQTALSNLFNRNMAGRNTSESELANANNQKLQNQQAYQQQLNTGFEQQQETKGPTLGDILGGVGSTVLGGLGGGLGGAVGKAAGGLFGGNKPQVTNFSYGDNGKVSSISQGN